MAHKHTSRARTDYVPPATCAHGECHHNARCEMKFDKPVCVCPADCAGHFAMAAHTNDATQVCACAHALHTDVFSRWPSVAPTRTTMRHCVR
jgi:hypothetical protein